MERLGEVTVPSGALAILDPGHIGMWQTGELDAVPSLRVDGLPRDRALPVVGERTADGRWAYVDVQVADGAPATREHLGALIVDFARLMVADVRHPEHWIHDNAIDGKADFVFWGRDAAMLAKVVRAPDLGDGQYGWKDQPVDDIIRLGTSAEQIKMQRGWKLATDFRPHSHHFLLLEQVRSSPTESGTLDIADLRVCLFMTSGGDGEFPVFVDRDAAGRILRVRVVFTAE